MGTEGPIMNKNQRPFKRPIDMFKRNISAMSLTTLNNAEQAQHSRKSSMAISVASPLNINSTKHINALMNQSAALDFTTVSRFPKISENT